MRRSSDLTVVAPAAVEGLAGFPRDLDPVAHHRRRRLVLLGGDDVGLRTKVETVVDDNVGLQLTTQRIQIVRSEEHTSELQSLTRISYAVFCLKKQIIMSHIQKKFI